MQNIIGNIMIENNSRKKKAKKNIVLGFLNKIVITILEFISRFFFIKFLGEELLGINGVFSNVIQLLSLAELGLNNVVSYSFYNPLANNDKDKIASLINFYKKIYNIIAFFILVLGLLLFPIIELLIKTDIQIPHIKLIYLIFLLDTVFSYLFVYKTILLNADQKGYINNSFIIITNTIRIVLQIISLIIFKNIFIYLSIRVFLNLLCNYLLSKRTDKEYPYITNKQNKDRININEKKELFRTIKSGFIYKLSAILLNSTDNILISLLVGTIWVGYIANYDTIYSGIGSFYVILFSSLTPSIGNLVETETPEKKFYIFKTMNFVASWMAVVFSTCFFTLSGEFISIWIGNKFVLDLGSVISKAFIIFLSCSMQPIFSFREALGLYKKTKYVMLAAAIINIILSLLFGKYFGIKGILFASIISMLSTYFWYEPYLLYRQFFYQKYISFLMKKGLDIIVVLFSYFITTKIFKSWTVFSYGSWFFKALTTFFFVNFICLIIYGFFPEFKNTLRLIKNTLKRG